MILEQSGTYRLIVKARSDLYHELDGNDLSDSSTLTIGIKEK